MEVLFLRAAPFRVTFSLIGTRRRGAGFLPEKKKRENKGEINQTFQNDEKLSDRNVVAEQSSK